MHFIIYCDESVAKGRFYSDFYGGALIRASDRARIEGRLLAAKSPRLQGELKWTKISEYNESDYVAFLSVFFDMIGDGSIKFRVMFTQNINRTDHLAHNPDEKYFKLYYQFIKHAFGLRFCNSEGSDVVTLSVLLDNAPDTKEKLDRFKTHLSGLSEFSIWRSSRVQIVKDAIMEVRSHEHIVLQAVDVVLGSMQFRLNEHHRDIAPGQVRRGKRTRAKERVFKFISERIRAIYPNFNIGVTTGQSGGRRVRWSHPYRHWCFVAANSRTDLERAKKKRKPRNSLHEHPQQD